MNLDNNLPGQVLHSEKVALKLRFLYFAVVQVIFFLYFCCCCPWALFVRCVYEGDGEGVKKMSPCGILKNRNGIIVIYWPSTEPSIKRCTCVKKRKNSRSRWTLQNNITRWPGGSSQSETGCQSENQLADWGLCSPQWPTVEQPQPRWGRRAAIVERRTWVNIAVRPCLHSFLTHNKHHPFRK